MVTGLSYQLEVTSQFLMSPYLIQRRRNWLRRSKKLLRVSSTGLQSLNQRTHLNASSVKNKSKSFGQPLARKHLLDQRISWRTTQMKTWALCISTISWTIIRLRPKTHLTWCEPIYRLLGSAPTWRTYPSQATPITSLTEEAALSRCPDSKLETTIVLSRPC